MKIFISYSSKDRLIVRTIAFDLRRCGHTVWMDESEIRGGQVWWDKIIVAIQDNELFINAFSQNSLASIACKLEHEYAVNLNKRILPVLVSATNVKMLPPEISSIQFVDYVMQDKESLLKLIEAIAALPAAKPLPDPLPVPPDAPISPVGRLKSQIELSSLSKEEQIKIVFELKQLVQADEDLPEIQGLLSIFRARAYVLASIASELDQLSGDVKSKLSPTKEGLIIESSNIRASPPSSNSRLLGTLTTGMMTNIIDMAPTNGYVQLAEQYGGQAGWILATSILFIPQRVLVPVSAEVDIDVVAAPPSPRSRKLGVLKAGTSTQIIWGIYWNGYAMLAQPISGETAWVPNKEAQDHFATPIQNITNS